MKSYCLKCRKHTESVNQKVSNTSNGKTVILSKWTVCGSKNRDSLKITKQRDY